MKIGIVVKSAQGYFIQRYGEDVLTVDMMMLKKCLKMIWIDLNSGETQFSTH